MTKPILDQAQIEELARANKYKVNQKTKFISRCIDGRYENSDDLPPLAIAGADVGELALVFATAREYGFEIDRQKVFKTLAQVVGDEKNLQAHTHCGHRAQLLSSPESYNLTRDDTDFIDAQKIHEVVLHGEHMEGAVLIVTGHYSVKTRYKNMQVFVFHNSLVDERHRLFAERLIANKVVKLPKSCDAEYLYEVMSNMTENHLFETAKRLAPGLPMFQVDFADDGYFKIKEL